jgi:hypothetical protein
MKKNGMGFSRIGAPKKDDIRLFHFAIGAGAASRAENRRQTGDAWGVSSPVATIDVVATDDRADKFLRDVVELIGGLGATEHAEGARAMLGDFTADPSGDAVESFFPRCRTMLSVLAD